MTIFAFEDIPPDLPRPPAAAQRALAISGINMSIAIWQSLNEATRRVLTVAGAGEIVDPNAVRGALRGASFKVQMRHPISDPSTDFIPQDLEDVLGPWRAHVAFRWRSMPALYRFVLAMLAPNPRLLWHAVNEIAHRGRWAGFDTLPPIHGLLARCEVRISTKTFGYLNDLRFHGGRSTVLARVAGVRAARKLSELIDKHAHDATGRVELESGPLFNVGLLFQAHVSTAGGAFSEAGSLLAATTAAVALIDLLRQVDDRVRITAAGISDEPWLFGGVVDSETTIAF
jgi:molybdenum cofactor biosynthesis enzyme